MNPIQEATIDITNPSVVADTTTAEVETTDNPLEPAQVETNEEVTTEGEDLIELSDGTKVTAQELLNGYLRQKDYTQKTQTLATERKKLEDAMAGLGKINPEITTPKPKANERKYKPEQLDELKSVLNDLGYVSKHELNAMTEKRQREETINGFFAQHPEYSAENDPGDVKISALRKELAMYNYSDLNVLPKALIKAHEEVSKTWGTELEKSKALAMKMKTKATTIGSGGVSTPSPSVNAGNAKRYTRQQIEIMKEMGVYTNQQAID